MSAFRSSLAPYAGSMRDADPATAKKFAFEMMERTGWIVLDPSWIDSWGDREFVKAVAERVRREQGGKHAQRR